jgi:hypothetical protein
LKQQAKHGSARAEAATNNAVVLCSSLDISHKLEAWQFRINLTSNTTTKLVIWRSNLRFMIQQLPTRIMHIDVLQIIHLKVTTDVMVSLLPGIVNQFIIAMSV